MSRLILVMFVIASLGIGALGCAAEDQAEEARAAQTRLAYVAMLAETGKIESIKIFHANNRLSTTVPMSAEKLKRTYEYKLEINPRWAQTQRMVEAFRNTSTRPLALRVDGIDVRTLILIHTTRNELIEISLTGPGVWAVVGGHPAELSRELSSYVGTLFGSEAW